MYDRCRVKPPSIYHHQCVKSSFRLRLPLANTHLWRDYVERTQLTPKEISVEARQDFTTNLKQLKALVNDKQNRLAYMLERCPHPLLKGVKWSSVPHPDYSSSLDNKVQEATSEVVRPPKAQRPLMCGQKTPIDIALRRDILHYE